MPQLIKNITAVLYDDIVGSIVYTNYLESDIQQEDYISMDSFKAYLQDLVQVEYSLSLNKPINFGLNNQYNVPQVTLSVNY